MNPIDPDRSRRGVLAGGNFIVDHLKCLDRWPDENSLAHVLSESKHNGGGPYNVLKDLTRLGADFPLAAVGLVGADDHGTWIRNDCAAAGIAVDQLHTTTAAATSYTDVMSVQATGRRTFFHQSGANAILGPEHFDLSRVAARYLYLGYLLLLPGLDAPDGDGRPRAAGLLRRARESGMTTVLDCVSHPGDAWATVVVPVLPEVDLLFANEYEVERLTGIAIRASGTTRPDDVERAGHRLLELGVRQRVFLHDATGVWALGRDGRVTWRAAVAVPPEVIAGTAGAGDALAAGILYGLHEDWPLDRALELGVCTAAASLRHASASDGVARADEVLELGRAWSAGGSV